MRKNLALFVGVLSLSLFLTIDVRAVSFTASDRFIAESSYNGQVTKLWDAQTGHVAFRSPRKEGIGTRASSTLSGDGHLLFLLRRTSIEVLDANTQQKVSEIPLGSHSGLSIHANRDGSRLILWGETITVIDVTKGAPLSEITECRNEYFAKVSPDGSQVLGLCGEATPQGGWRTYLKLFDANTGKILHILNGPEKAILAFMTEISFSAGGRFAILNSTYFHGIWDTQSGKPLTVQDTGLAEVGSISVSRDEKAMVISGRSMKVIDIDTGQLLQSIPKHCDQSILSLDRTSLFCANYYGLSEWDLISGKLRRWLHKRESHDDCLLELSQNGSLLAYTNLPPSGYKSKGTLVFDTRSGRAKFGLQTMSPNGKAKISVDAYGKRFAWLASQYLVEVRNIETGALEHQIALPTYTVWSDLQLSPDGNKVLVPHSTHLTVVYDVKTGTPLLSSDNMGWDNQVTACFSPNGNAVLMGNYSGTYQVHPGRLIDLNSGQIVGSINAEFSGCTFLDQDTVVITDNGYSQFEVWSLSSGTRISAQKSGLDPKFYMESGLVVDPAGGAVEVREIRTGAIKLKLPEGRHPLRLSTDGKLLAVMHHRMFEVWSVADKREIGHADLFAWGTRVTFSPDGKRTSVIGIGGDTCHYGGIEQIFDIHPDRLESVSRSSWRETPCYSSDTYFFNASHVPNQPDWFVGSDQGFLTLMDISAGSPTARWKAEIDLEGDGR